MKLYESQLWISDLDRVLSSFPVIGRLEGSTVMVTGAAGLVCSAVTDLLIRYNETHPGKIGILAAGRWPEEMRDRFGPYFDRDYFTYVPYDASKTDNALDFPCDYIIHGAGNSSPDRIMKEPVETMLANFMGVRYLLDHAVKNRIKRMLYISSSEVYGKKEGNRPYRNNEYGYIDLLDPRNSYSVGKRAAETLCASYRQEYGMDSVIVRPGHIYGPTASPADKHVASAWAYAAARGEPVVMKSDGAQLRSYCYCLDCASAILTVLLKGQAGEAYNISNPDSVITIRQMAELLSSAGNVDIRMELPDEAEKKGFNPMSNSSLDSSRLESLGWKGLFDARTGFEHTVSVIHESIQS